MAAITETVTSITEMVRGRTEDVPLDDIVRQPTLYSVRTLVKQLATSTMHFAITKWGGKHRLLLLVLSEAKMRPAARNRNLDCERLKKTEPLKPKNRGQNPGSRAPTIPIGQEG